MPLAVIAVAEDAAALGSVITVLTPPPGSTRVVVVVTDVAGADCGGGGGGGGPLAGDGALIVKLSGAEDGVRGEEEEEATETGES